MSQQLVLHRQDPDGGLLSVLKGLPNHTGETLLGPMLVHLETFASQSPQRRAKILSERTIHLDHAKVAILDRNVARDLLEQQSVAALALAKLFLQAPDMRHVG